MSSEDRFEIPSFDPHPAFRLTRTFRRKRQPSAPRIEAPTVRVWPLPSLGGSSPAITGPCEEGVSIAYAADASLPRLVPVFAVSDGTVKLANNTQGVGSLVLDHGDGHRSYYAGIHHLLVLPTNRYPGEQQVKAGTVIGYVDTTKFCGLVFLLSKLHGHWHYEPVDAREALDGWQVLPWTDDRATPPPTSQPLAA